MSEPCDKGRRVDEIEIEVSTEFTGVHVEVDDEVSYVRHSEPSKVFYDSDVRTSYVLISSEPSKVDLKFPTYSFGSTGPFPDGVSASGTFV